MSGEPKPGTAGQGGVSGGGSSGPPAGNGARGGRLIEGQDILAILRDLHFLADLSDELLRELALLAEVREYDAREVVVRQGEPATAIYVVVSGQVSLEVCAAGVGCKRILTIGPGELLGWSAVLDPIQWTATARTSSATRVVRLDGARLRAMCDRAPVLGYQLMLRVAQALSRRLNATRLQLLDVYGATMPSTPDEGGMATAAAASHPASSTRR